MGPLCCRRCTLETLPPTLPVGCVDGVWSPGLGSNLSALENGPVLEAPRFDAPVPECSRDSDVAPLRVGAIIVVPCDQVDVRLPCDLWNLVDRIPASNNQLRSVPFELRRQVL